MAGTTDSVIDETSLKELLELDRCRQHTGIFERVVRIYLKHTPGLLSELGYGIREGDAERVFTAAHSLKSSSLNVGATTLSALCKDLETLGRSGTTTGAPALFGQIEPLYQRVVAALEDRIRLHSSSRS